MYRDKSTTTFPKHLIIRNHLGGMVWQVYKVEKESEAIKLANNASKNGFADITLENFDKDLEETFPDWRDTKGGKLIIK